MVDAIRCSNCGANLGPGDLDKPACPYCNTTHPHVAEARRQVEGLQQVYAQGGLPGMMGMGPMPGQPGAPYPPPAPSPWQYGPPGQPLAPSPWQQPPPLVTGNLGLGFCAGFFGGIIGLILVYIFAKGSQTKRGATIGFMIAIGLVIVRVALLRSHHR